MNTGSYTIDILETCKFGLDGGAMFGVVPQALWQRAYAEGDEKNRIPMTARALLIRGHGRKILVDTGNGSKFDDKFRKIYAIEDTEKNLQNSLQQHGLSTDEITDVVLTHLHFDHAGGATTRNTNGEVIPAFANAQYHVQKEQFEWALNPVEKDKASFLPENYVPLKEHGVLNLLEGSGELFPKLFVEPVHGHTRFLQMIRIDDSQRVMFPSDLMPTHAHVRVPFGMAYDNEPLRTLQEKKHWLPILHEQEYQVLFQHDAFWHSTRIELTDKGYAPTTNIEID